MPQFAKGAETAGMAGAVPEPRAFQEAAGRWLEALTREAAGVSTVRLRSCSIDVIEALRSAFILLGGALFREEGTAPLWGTAGPGRHPLDGVPSRRQAAGDSESGPPEGGVTALRARLWTWRHRLHRVRPWQKQPGRTFLLAVPRTPDHVYDIVPVARVLQDSGLSTVYVSFRGLRRLLEKFSVDVVDFTLKGTLGDLGNVRNAIDCLTKVAERAAASFEDPLGSKDAALQLTRRVFRDGVADAIWFAGRFEEAIGRYRPRVIMVGNPFTIEGRVAALIARELSIPAFCVQHGTIFPNDPYWFHCPVDRVFAWGAPSRDALLSNGLAPTQIVVAGAPRLDAFSGPGKTPSYVLVATSGAGDQVSMERHLSFISTLFEAASRLPAVQWVIKLHPKDDRRLYEKALRDRGIQNVTVTEGKPDRKGIDIYEFLREAAALVTVVSTTALDALACDVPVVAVLQGGKEEYEHVDFIRRGAVACVGTASELASSISDVLSGRRNTDVEQAASALVAEQFANRGNAASFIAGELARLGEERPNAD